MCTITWFASTQGYEVFFNRDELNSRQRAVPPLLQQQLGISYLAPTDPDGGGTWISVNQFGLTLSLLNNYHAATQFSPHHRTSRGLLVKQLAPSNCVEQLATQLQALDLNNFQPFDLLAFSPGQPPQLFAWDGIILNRRPAPKPPFTSSSFKTDEVIRNRLSQLSVTQSLSPELLLRFHTSHEPSKSAYSICMHRADAGTVSLSHIKVNGERALFRYWDGPPCSTDATQSLTLVIGAAALVGEPDHNRHVVQDATF